MTALIVIATVVYLALIAVVMVLVYRRLLLAAVRVCSVAAVVQSIAVLANVLDGDWVAFAISAVTLGCCVGLAVFLSRWRARTVR